jgi:hypothetical protein
MRPSTARLSGRRLDECHPASCPLLSAADALIKFTPRFTRGGCDLYRFYGFHIGGLAPRREAERGDRSFGHDARSAIG